MLRKTIAPEIFQGSRERDRYTLTGNIAAKYGASNIRVFGSYARGEETPDSDLDLLIDFKQRISLLDRIALKQELGDLLGITVDIARPENLHEIIRENVLAETIPLSMAIPSLHKPIPQYD